MFFGAHQTDDGKNTRNHKIEDSLLHEINGGLLITVALINVNQINVFLSKIAIF